MNVAVLVPVYQAERYLRDCLESILSQTFRNLEIYCCDDGSTDGSAAILAEVASREPRLHVLSQKNRGVAATRNRLMDALPPDIDAFGFVDSDDEIAPQMYAALAEALGRTGADVAECEWDGCEKVIDDMTQFCLKRTSEGAFCNVINKLYRRSSVGNIRFREDLAFEEDYFFNAEVNAAIAKKVLVPGRFYTYRDNPNSATHALNFEKYFDSTSRRIRLSCEVFLKKGRVPERLEGAFRAELAKDAYRMCIRKNLKKNGDAHLRREIFLRAGRFIAEMEREEGLRPNGLNVVQRAVYRSCVNGNYHLARALSALT